LTASGPRTAPPLKGGFCMSAPMEALRKAALAYACCAMSKSVRKHMACMVSLTWWNCAAVSLGRSNTSGGGRRRIGRMRCSCALKRFASKICSPVTFHREICFMEKAAGV